MNDPVDVSLKAPQCHTNGFIRRDAWARLTE